MGATDQEYGYWSDALPETYTELTRERASQSRMVNDKAFIALTGRSERTANRINLQEGKPVIFGGSGESCVVMEDGEARIKPTSSVSPDQILVHDPSRENPSVAFSISRLSHTPHGPTPLGVFRNVSRPTYGSEMQQQIVDAQNRGPGDLDALFSSAGTWEVT